jgi:hypothetical protein
VLAAKMLLAESIKLTSSLLHLSIQDRGMADKQSRDDWQ